MFSFNHFLWLAICAGAIWAGLFWAVRKHISIKTAGSIMSGICILSEGSKMMTHLLPSPMGGMALNPEALPFHLCSMLLFVVFYITLTKNEAAREKAISFIAPVGLLGGIAAMLIPIDGVDFRDILAYQCYVYHAGLCWFSLYFILTKQADLGLGAYVRNVLILLALAGMNIYINGALIQFGTNFMFLVRPPMEGLPVLNLNHGWYAYFAAILGLGLTALTLVHLPFLIRRRK